MRLNEMISGVPRTWPPCSTATTLVSSWQSCRDRAYAQAIPGAADVSTEQVTASRSPGPCQPDQIARYGISPRRCSTDRVARDQAVGTCTRDSCGSADRPVARGGPRQPGGHWAILVTTPAGERIPLERLTTNQTIEDLPQSNASVSATDHRVGQRPRAGSGSFRRRGPTEGCDRHTVASRPGTESNGVGSSSISSGRRSGC